MTPTSIAGAPSASRSASSSARAARYSSSVATIGNMTLQPGGRSATASDRAQLGAQELLVGEPEPDPAHAEERVVLGRLAQERQRLVGPGVERADDHRAAAERRGDLRVDRALLLLGRRVVAVEEQELGAQQADAVGAELDRGGRLGRRAEVGGDLERRRRRACAPARARARARVRPRSCASRARRARARRPSSARRVDLDGPGVAVDDQHRPVRHARARRRRARRRPGCRARARGSRRATSRRRAPRPARARARGRAPRRRPA